VELHNGVKTTREVVRHQGAVAVLPRLPDGRFLLVEQFRKPVDQPLREVVAGTLEPGEDPRACAHRELEEETGWKAGRMEPLGAIYPTPGYVDEKIDLFFAQCEGRPTGLSLDHDEHIRLHTVTKEEIIRDILDGSIRDAKTLCAWLLYEKTQVGSKAE
jgi:ADP-ribose pyrophosphatase